MYEQLVSCTREVGQHMVREREASPVREQHREQQIKLLRERAELTKTWDVRSSTKVHHIMGVWLNFARVCK
eukprot:2866853-Lingulodinium_polyedra.AAC.1